MSTWQPEDGETLLSRSYVSFATGANAAVSGKHWFRDTQRRDISAQLPGWPAAPIHTARGKGTAGARKGVKGLALTVGILVLGLLNANGVDINDKDARGTSEDPDNEIDDFPVIWGDPGSIATTLPWQLDTDRVDEKHYRTHLVITDQRLVILGLPKYKKELRRIEDELLWAIPRSQVAGAELCNYIETFDIRITFTDGSWCRLRDLGRLTSARYLVYDYEPRTSASLLPSQRTAVQEYVAENGGDRLSAPYITRRTCGHYIADFYFPASLDSHFGLSTDRFVFDTDGNEVSVLNWHPEDD